MTAYTSGSYLTTVVVQSFQKNLTQSLPLIVAFVSYWYDKKKKSAYYCECCTLLLLFMVAAQVIVENSSVKAKASVSYLHMLLFFRMGLF
jgi:glucose-6-phosphate isomerase